MLIAQNNLSACNKKLISTESAFMLAVIVTKTALKNLLVTKRIPQRVDFVFIAKAVRLSANQKIPLVPVIANAVQTCVAPGQMVDSVIRLN